MGSTHCWRSTRDNKWQPAYCCFLTTILHPYSIECLPMMKSGFCMKLPSIPDIGCHLRIAVPHTTRLPMHPHKIMLCVWWTGCQVVHYELLPIGQMVTGDLYSQQLEHVQQALCQKEPALVNCKGVLFLHDNARPHVM